VTVDSVVEELEVRRLDVIKIDTDGDELAVLRGAIRTLEKFHPLIIVETGCQGGEIVELLNDYGYLYLCDQIGKPIFGPPWPPNVLADMRPVRTPPRGGLNPNSFVT